MSGTPKILTLDLETSPILAYVWSLWKVDISIQQIVEPTRMLSWAAKWHDKPTVMFASEHHDGHQEMVERIWKLVDEADIVVHFNGATFDMPHLRREFDYAGLPQHSPVQEIDLLKVARKQYRLPSYKLDYIVQYFGIGAKVSHAGFSLWRRCLDGDEAAWNVMRRYNKGDVTVTEKLYDKLRPVIRNHPHVGLYTGEVDCCSNCGSKNLTHRGFSLTGTGKYQRYQCGDCGKWSRGKRAVATVDARGVA